MDEPLITQQDIEALKSRDSRWKDIEIAIRVDEELRDSPTVNLILEAFTRRSTSALESLIVVDPTDVRQISALQEQVKAVRYIGEEFKRIRENGLIAETHLREEGDVSLNNS